MFAISVSVGVVSWRLLYKDSDNAQKNFKIIRDAITERRTEVFTPAFFVDMTDEFGQQFVARVDSINGLVFEDLEKSKLGNIEFSLHSARTQIDYQQRYETDPKIRGGMASRGPGIITPMGPMPNGGRPLSS